MYALFFVKDVPPSNRQQSQQTETRKSTLQTKPSGRKRCVCAILQLLVLQFYLFIYLFSSHAGWTDVQPFVQLTVFVNSSLRTWVSMCVCALGLNPACGYPSLGLAL